MKSHYSIFIVMILFASCITKKELFFQPSDNVAISKDITPESKAAILIEPYTKRMAESMNRVIGFSPSFEEKSKPSSALGSFMCDAVLEIAVDSLSMVNFCVLNYGGIRSTLDSGNITVGEMFQLMPFENEIVVLKLEVKYLDSLRNIIALKGGEPMSKPDKVISQNLDFFWLATNDYMANGGDNYGILANAVERVNTGIKIRDALISYVTDRNNIIFDYQPRNL